MVGIKGSGMTSLACLLKKMGHNIIGSDLSDKYYTDDILIKNNIEFIEDFQVSITQKYQSIDLLIYSVAYSEKTNNQILEAKNNNIQILTYPQALGYFSKSLLPVCVSGIHGKTTVTSIITKLMIDLTADFVSIIGSGLKNLDGDSFYYKQNPKYFIVESCEYKRHFLNFNPYLLLISSIELDHTDYYKDIDDVKDAFFELSCKVLPDGIIVYHNESNVKNVIEKVKKIRKDIKYISYGENADFEIQKNEADYFMINNTKIHSQSFLEHFKINTLGAIACVSNLVDLDMGKVSESIASFTGNKRRAEFLGQYNDILFYDDYGHHPTAIYKTLSGFKKHFPQRRIICSFASHTYSRTYSLLEEFITCFCDSDILIVHDIYGSRRELGSEKITSKQFADSIKHNNKIYIPNFYDAFDYLIKELKSGDLFLSMGAGDNFNLTNKLVEYYKKL